MQTFLRFFVELIFFATFAVVKNHSGGLAQLAKNA